MSESEKNYSWLFLLQIRHLKSFKTHPAHLKKCLFMSLFLRACDFGATGVTKHCQERKKNVLLILLLYKQRIKVFLVHFRLLWKKQSHFDNFWFMTDSTQKNYNDHTWGYFHYNLEKQQLIIIIIYMVITAHLWSMWPNNPKQRSNPQFARKLIDCLINKKCMHFFVIHFLFFVQSTVVSLPSKLIQTRTEPLRDNQVFTQSSIIS